MTEADGSIATSQEVEVCVKSLRLVRILLVVDFTEIVERTLDACVLFRGPLAQYMVKEVDAFKDRIIEMAHLAAQIGFDGLHLENFCLPEDDAPDVFTLGLLTMFHIEINYNDVLK